MFCSVVWFLFLSFMNIVYMYNQFLLYCGISREISSLASPTLDIFHSICLTLNSSENCAHCHEKWKVNVYLYKSHLEYIFLHMLVTPYPHKMSPQYLKHQLLLFSSSLDLASGCQRSCMMRHYLLFGCILLQSTLQK